MTYVCYAAKFCFRFCDGLYSIQRQSSNECEKAVIHSEP